MLRNLCLIGCLAALATPSLAAETARTMVASGARSSMQFGQPNPMPIAMSLRGGIMAAPRGAGLAGVDIAVPGISLMEGWEGRLDADVIFKANFADISTVVPVTLNQVRYVQDMTGRSIYYGLGGGALLGGKAKLIGKGILGFELNARLGVEGNIIVTDAKTMVTVVGRLHL